MPALLNCSVSLDPLTQVEARIGRSMRREHFIAHSDNRQGVESGHSPPFTKIFKREKNEP